MASHQSDVNQTLRKAIFETLSAILSPIDDLRFNAEQQINILEVTDAFGVNLTELTLDINAPLGVRQLASVLLRQYVESHWSSYADKFRSPEVPPEEKAAIRALLPMGLQEPFSKVRSSVAYAIAAIAHWDWPEVWPELFDLLMLNLTSENCYAVHGAMRALTEVSRDVSDTQMPQVAPLILPQMYKIFSDVEKYSIRTRGRAVEIFMTCVEIIAAMTESQKGEIKNLLSSLLPQFTSALVKSLSVPDGEISDSGLKKDVLNALRMLIRCVPKQMGQWISHILSPVWSALTDSANLYISTVVNVTEDANNPTDSDGEVLGFENLVFSIFDFVTGMVESPKFKGFVANGMSDLLYYVILYMQVTEEQARIWGSDPDRFIEDEDDDSFSYSVRISSQDLLMLLGQDFEDETAVGLCSAITRHIEETNKNGANPHWWKVHESCLLALGSLQELVVGQIQNNNLPFDLIGFLQSVILIDLNISTSPFLLGRCLWAASRFAIVMPDDLLIRFLQTTVSGLQQTQPSCVRVSAARAVYGFCDQLKTSNRTACIIPFLPALVDGLLDLSQQFASDVVCLSLEAVSMAITVDQNFTSTCESKVGAVAVMMFVRHCSDPVLLTIAQEIFKVLCQNPTCAAPLERRLLPILLSTIQAPNSKAPIGLQGACIDVLQTIVRYSARPLSDELINHAFPAAVYCMMHTDDNTLMQNGGECLRAYVSVALEQIANWRDGNGRNGLDYVINVIEMLLDPRTSESAAAFVGSLVTVLLQKAGSILGEKAEQILRAVLSKMQQSQSLSIIQNFVLVYAQLCRNQMELVLDFLSGIPGPTGKSALEFVLVEWCQCHHMFIGSYENKVSSFSLSMLLEYSIKTNDKRLQEIEVKGDPIVNYNEGIRTRSKSAQNPEQWTQIPLLVKIYKLLIEDLANQYENYNQDDGTSDEDIDDSADNHGDELASAMPALNADFFGYDVEPEAESDPDILQDPLHKMNFKSYLFEFLQKLSHLQCYSSFSEHHTLQEKQLLTTFGIL